MTLRTVSPHTSRVVSPTSPSSRSSAGTLSNWTKWSWTFCRAVRCPQPRLCSGGHGPEQVELVAVTPP